MSQPFPRLTAQQEGVLLELMTGTFDIPEGRARRYILQFREMALEIEGDVLLAHGDQMDPRIAERAWATLLARAKALDDEFNEVSEDV